MMYPLRGFASEVSASTALIRLPIPTRILAPSDGAAQRADHDLGSITVASLRTARKLHLVRLSDPATSVVTAFAGTDGFTVVEGCPADRALREMFRFGLHVLVVRRNEEVISGLVTPEDIEGERTQHFLHAHSHLQREDVRVRDILTPCEELPAVNTETIRYARVSDLVHLFEAIAASYLLVLEGDGAGPLLLRGHVWRSRLERQLEPRL